MTKDETRGLVRHGSESVMRFAWLLLGCLALTAWTPRYAHAQTKKPSASNVTEAKRLFRAGARAYDAGEFAAAAEAFEQAYVLSPRPPLRFSAAQALKRQYVRTPDLALLKKARGYYSNYVDAVKQGRRVKDAVDAIAEIDLIVAKREPATKATAEEGGNTDAPDIPSAPPIKPAAVTTGILSVEAYVPGATAVIAGVPGTLEKLPVWLEMPFGTYEITIRAKGYLPVTRTARISPEKKMAVVYPQLEEKPARVEVKTDSSADILVDGKPAGRGPRSLELPSGTHRIVVGRNGYDIFSEDLIVGRDESRTIDATLGMTTQRILGWVVLGGAGVTVSAGILLGVAAANEQRQARELFNLTEGDSARALNVTERDRYNSHISTRDNLNRFAGGAVGLGAAAAIAGMLMVIIDEPDLYEAAATTGDEGVETEKETPKKSNDDLEATLDLGASAVPLLGGGSRGGLLVVTGKF